MPNVSTKKWLRRARGFRYSIVLGLVIALLAMKPAGRVTGRLTVEHPAGPLFHMTVSATPATRPLAQDFLGLALEYRAIPYYVGNPSAPNPLFVQLVRNLIPTGRPLIRIGGQSTDRTWWPVPGMRQPIGVTYSLGRSWLTVTSALVKALGAQLIVGVNLEANRQRLASYEARQLLSGLGAQNVAAFDIGNEPELYTFTPWYRLLNGKAISWASHQGEKIFSRRGTYNPADFLQEFTRTLKVMPPATIAGPDTGFMRWLGPFIQSLSPSSPVKMVTWHAYGLNECITDPASPEYPTVPNLLAPFASRAMLAGVGPSIAKVHQLGDKFRIDEMGSVTCNGRPGVSNVFATSLWAPDALFSLISSGVDGVNLHTFPQEDNGLFDFSRVHGQWTATVHPLYYGVLMFSQAAPPGSQILRIQSDSQKDVRGWATRAPDHLIRVLLINDNLHRTYRAEVRVANGSGAASVERLEGRSAYATTAIRFGGNSFGAQSSTGKLPTPGMSSVSPLGGVYSVALAPGSAALMTLKER